MSRKRKEALARAASLVPQLEEHLAKIAANPDHSSVPHWKREVRGWLHQIEAMRSHVGKKTAAEWQSRIDTWRAALDD